MPRSAPMAMAVRRVFWLFGSPALKATISSTGVNFFSRKRMALRLRARRRGSWSVLRWRFGRRFACGLRAV
ncbi:hypothetical protein BU25DRAFT_493971 [Macroventuria anomochaeta]|uniref:Uncharacterized protein n=1 Tax=Macroventuria anomochaeta TaxID=301207 RepID=A0ACB6RS87_9PLEO|nr:uncharacterized protein BU25DRAFT_493971 [Macroventuria anomochaeta]KAF2623784.1 hypothetical protein BU25DRAFT_493971 [Macroventuria anomochaeta]